MKETFDIKEVMERYKRGNKKEAAEEMCIQFRPLVYKIVNNYCFNENIREDLEQEGFVSIINGMRCYDPEKSSPVTYFSRCITNAARDYAWKDKYKVSRYYMKEISEVKQAVIDLENSNIPASVENVSEYIKVNRYDEIREKYNDLKVEKEYTDAEKLLASRELSKVKEAKDTFDKLTNQNDYKDSRKKAEEAQAIIDAENKRKNKNKKRIAIASLICITAMILFGVVTKIIIPTKIAAGKSIQLTPNVLPVNVYTGQ